MEIIYQSIPMTCASHEQCNKKVTGLKSLKAENKILIFVQLKGTSQTKLVICETKEQGKGVQHLSL